LKTDKIDIFYLHAPDWATLLDETVKGMNDLYKEGKVGQFGLSNFTVRLAVITANDSPGKSQKCARLREREAGFSLQSTRVRLLCLEVIDNSH